jgi:hypothetical protein
MAFASGYFKTSYASDLAIVETRARWVGLMLLLTALTILPLLGSPFLVDLANQVFLALIGSVALMLLTGYAGQISLGHAGFVAAGAFTTGILVKELQAPIWLTLPASGIVGAGLGIFFGLPSLRLKGLYLALSTLALHFIVIYVGAEYETKRGFATGIVLEPPRLGPFVLQDPSAWYFVLLIASLLVIIFAVNIVRSRTGRAWMAIRDRDIAAAAFGIKVSGYKLSCFFGSHQHIGEPFCILPRLCFSRGFFALPDHSVPCHCDHRGVGLDLGGCARHFFCSAPPLFNRLHNGSVFHAVASDYLYVRGEAKFLRIDHDTVPYTRTHGIGGPLDENKGLFPSLAF